MSEFHVIETQEQFDNAIKERLDRLNTKHADEVGSLQTALNESKAEIEKLKSDAERIKNGNAEQFSSMEAKIAEISAENAALRYSAVKRDVADRYNLPKEFAERLKGETEEELASDAEKLAAFINQHRGAQMPAASAEPNVDPNAEYFKKKYGANPYYKK